ncbi:hypothetical protein [Nocardia yamanashiensis]|uniref:hypothetical protein n=1 Tax=Nocardia yamanashiensis TaxID=209247 RepID=UPI00083769CB|nr:hypothetical protein [Nocardia yamanashiensis]
MTAGSDVAEVVAEIEDAAKQRKLRAMEPERNLIAALLNLDTTAAAEILSHVRTTDFADHLCAAVSVLIRHLVNEHRQPSPQAVVTLARGLGERLGQFHLTPDRVGLFVSEVYTLGNPLTSWDSARLVIEDSYRRRYEADATRIAQMAADYAPIRDLVRYVAAAVARWRREHARLTAITRRATHTPERNPR